MPRLSLTDLVDVFSKSGKPRATKVSQIKNRGDYHPAFDIYKIFRDGVVAIHKGAAVKAEVDKLKSGHSDPGRAKQYPVLVAAYKKWWGRKSLTWFDPATDFYTHAGVDVSVNPELGLVIDGHRHVIKLYLKDEPLKKDKADLVIGLMRFSLGEGGVKYAVLDVKKSKLFVETSGAPSNKYMVDAELSYIASIWPSV